MPLALGLLMLLLPFRKATRCAPNGYILLVLLGHTVMGLMGVRATSLDAAGGKHVLDRMARFKGLTKFDGELQLGVRGNLEVRLIWKNEKPGQVLYEWQVRSPEQAKDAASAWREAKSGEMHAIKADVAKLMEYQVSRDKYLHGMEGYEQFVDLVSFGAQLFLQRQMSKQPGMAPPKPGVPSAPVSPNQLPKALPANDNGIPKVLPATGSGSS